MSKISIFAVLTSICCAASSPDADSVVAKYSAANNRIKTIEAKYLLSIVDKTPGAKVDPDGRAILFQYDWRFKKEDNWQFYDGEIGFINKGKWYYHGQVFAWDGQDFIAHHRGQKSALINANPWDAFQHFKSPMVLLGDALYGDFSTTTLDVLELGNKREVVSSNETSVILTTTFDWGLRPKTEDNCRLTLTLDPTHDHLAKDILITSLITETPIVHMLVEEYAQLPNGVWFPVKGQLTNYRTDRKEIPGAPEQVVATPAGVGTMFLRVTPASLSVNRELKKEAFQFALSKDIRWWDERTDKSYKPPKAP